MILLFNCNWVVTRWQQYSTVHIYTERHNETEYTERNINNSKNMQKKIPNITIRMHNLQN